MQFQTQAQLLATEQAGQLAKESIRNIEAVRRLAQVSVYVVMLISYLHQAMYLWDLMGAGFKSGLHGISGVIGSVLIPIAFDIYSLICIRIGTTIGLRRSTRRWALALLVIPTAMSGYVNVRSSIILENGWIIASIYIMVVALIPLVEFLRSRTHDIDYDAIDAVERRTMASGGVIPEVPEDFGQEAAARPTDPMMALVVASGGDIELAKGMVEYDKMSASDKQSWSRRYKNARARWLSEMADPVQSVRAVSQSAPVSPAGPVVN